MDPGRRLMVRGTNKWRERWRLKSPSGYFSESSVLGRNDGIFCNKTTQNESITFAQ